jgi:hypothetical protein
MGQTQSKIQQRNEIGTHLKQPLCAKTQMAGPVHIYEKVYDMLKEEKIGNR